MNTFLNEAIALMGGLTATGKVLGVSKGVVFQWKLREQAPAQYCPEIERITGISCEKLNKSMDWARMRSLPPVRTTKTKRK